MLNRTCFALAPVLNWVLLLQANLSWVHVSGSQASELEVMTAVISTEALTNVNF